MRCPRCKSDSCQLISEMETSGKPYSICKGLCGGLTFGKIGLLCGFCGEGQTTKTKNYWVCHNCGHKFKA